MSPPPARDRAESMSLLVDVARDALDPGYAAAHQAQRGRPPSPVRWARLLAGAGLVGLLLAAAAVQAQRTAPSAAAQRSALLSDVRRLTAQTDRLAGQLTRLQQATAAERDAVLGLTDSGRSVAARVAALTAATGAAPVRGPGLRVRLGDAAGGAAGSQVLDTDLQQVVDALWAAGAEAITIDGERLTSQSAIREAGTAILVDFRPVSSPYLVEAVGDPVALETAFAASPAAARFRTYAQLYGLQFDYRRAADLRLPAATVDIVRYARPIGATP